MSDAKFGIDEMNAAIDRLVARKKAMGAHAMLRDAGLPALISDYGLRHATSVFADARGPMSVIKNEDIGAALWIDGIMLGLELANGRCMDNDEG